MRPTRGREEREERRSAVSVSSCQMHRASRSLQDHCVTVEGPVLGYHGGWDLMLLSAGAALETRGAA